MRTEPTPPDDASAVVFRGGLAGALAPFVAFLAGVIALGLAGAPDERGFWPLLVAALALGLLLARDRAAYAEAVLAGMSRPIVMLMVMAWLLAGMLAALLNTSGLVSALAWLAGAAGVTGGGYVAAAFLIACAMSTATGTSLGTILLCAPLLYPAGGALGADPGWLIGALLAGATFGDNVSPVSDTTIASASSQDADMGGVVRSRLRYALPPAALALAVFAWRGGDAGRVAGDGSMAVDAAPAALVMLLAPALVIVLLLRRRHLFEGLLAGVGMAVAAGLALGLIAPGELLAIDRQAFIARGLLLDGMERGVGIAVFTILLMGLAGGLESSGVLARLAAFAAGRARGRRGAELWIVGLVSAAVLLTTHAVVAILTVGPFARETGARFAVDRYRRANLLDVTVCTYPFLLPWFIPTILAASTTRGAAGMPALGVWQVGLYNVHSWGLLAMVLYAVATGWGARPR